MVGHAVERPFFQDPRDGTVPTHSSEWASQRAVVPAFKGWIGWRRSRGPPSRESPSPALDVGAEAGKPGEPRRGREGILLSLPPSPPVAAHTGRAPGRGGGEDGASRAARGGDEESDPVR